MKQIAIRKTSRAVSGFTLVELLVVLVILTVLTTVAVQSVDGIQDQARYEATQRGLQHLDEAVLGPSNQRDADGSILVTGFVADIGRLPKAVDVNGTPSLQELWANPAGLKPFGIRQAIAPDVAITDADSEVFVPCGWRGPYLRLPIGAGDLRDGWGNAFDLHKADRSLAAVGDEVSIVRTRGADYPTLNTSPSNDYSEELYLNFVTNAFASPDYPNVSAFDRCHASPLQFTVKDPANSGNPDPLNGNIVVKYFGPDPATGGIKVIASAPATPSGSSPVSVSLTDAAISIGPRIVRAYQIDGGGAVIKKSDVMRVVLPPGGKQLELNLRTP